MPVWPCFSLLDPVFWYLGTCIQGPGTLITGNLPDYCTGYTLDLGTSSHLDSVAVYHTFTRTRRAGAGRCVQGTLPGPTYQGLATKVPHGPTWPYMVKYSLNMAHLGQIQPQYGPFMVK